MAALRAPADRLVRDGLFRVALRPAAPAKSCLSVVGHRRRDARWRGADDRRLPADHPRAAPDADDAPALRPRRLRQYRLVLCGARLQRRAAGLPRYRSLERSLQSAGQRAGRRARYPCLGQRAALVRRPAGPYGPQLSRLRAMGDRRCAGGQGDGGQGLERRVPQRGVPQRGVPPRPVAELAADHRRAARERHAFVLPHDQR